MVETAITDTGFIAKPCRINNFLGQDILGLCSSLCS